MKYLRFGILAATIAAVACSEPTSTAGPCGDAQEVTDGSMTVCVYAQELIEEGFLCPDDFATQFEFQEGSIGCASEPELTEEIEARLDDLGLEPVVDVALEPIRFTFTVRTDGFSKEVAFQEIIDGRSEPGWLKILRDGELLQIPTPCEVERCGEEALQCTVPTYEVFPDAIDGVSVSFDWDRSAWSGDMCQTDSEVMGEGVWEAIFCVGDNVIDGAPVDIGCETVPFDFTVTEFEHEILLTDQQ